jgi:tRNA(fMet)-specific endonuclease VapC
LRILLDTSAYSSFKRGDTLTLNTIRRSKEIIFSSVVAGELLAGFRNGNRFRANYEELLEFLEHPMVHLVSVGLTTAERYGLIYASLRRIGSPIPVNDMWVASQAMETGADLVTFDRHFENIENLALQMIESG